MGEETKQFEKEYAGYCGTKHCIGVANGLDALRLILKAWMEMGLMKEGDEIIVPANTYIASLLVITDNRLVPVLVELDINTYNIDPFLIEEKNNRSYQSHYDGAFIRANSHAFSTGKTSSKIPVKIK